MTDPDCLSVDDLIIQLQKRIAELEKANEFLHAEILERKDGSPLWALVNTKSSFDRDGKFAGSIGMLTNITEHKQAEEKLRYHANLVNVSDARSPQTKS